MSIKARSWLWLFVALALFLGVTAREVYQFIAADHRPPVMFVRAEVMNSPIRPGESLLIRVWREKVRDDCPVASAAFITDENGNITNLPGIFSIGGPSGTEFLDVSYLIPANTHPGGYELNDPLSYRCPDGEFVIPQPTARFVVR